jgi:acyl-coenzyme A synthetase/AMP-(fatty) acid ligase
VLAQHPAVRAVAVAAAPDAVRGDEVLALVIPAEPPRDQATRERIAGELVAWCLQRLAYYKAPGWVAFLDILPLTSTQKIQRGELKALALRLMEDPTSVDTRALKKRVAA